MGVSCCCPSPRGYELLLLNSLAAHYPHPLTQLCILKGEACCPLPASPYPALYSEGGEGGLGREVKGKLRLGK